MKQDNNKPNNKKPKKRIKREVTNKKIVKQKMQLLLENPDFQKDIKIFRKKWSIHQKGLKTKKDKKKWFKWLKEHPSEHQLGDFLYTDNEIDTNITPKNTKLNNDIDELLKKYKLSDFYKSSIKAYILFNDFDFIPFLNPAKMKMYFFQDEKKYRMFIEIFAETSVKDFQENWEYIKIHQKTLSGYKPGRQKQHPRLKRDERVCELARKGIRHKEIAKMVKKEFNLSGFTYDDVAKIIFRFKKKIMDI